MSVVTRPERPLAWFMSAAGHGAIILAAVLSVARGPLTPFGADDPPRASPPRWQQLRGDSARPGVGPNALGEILGAADAVSIQLSGNGADAPVGLAWWSPSRGLWLAIDRATRYAERTLQVRLKTGADRATLVALIDIDRAGEGRVVSRFASAPAYRAGMPATLTVLESARRPLTAAVPVLAGDVRPRVRRR